jgi:hypothetical protein
MQILIIPFGESSLELLYISYYILNRKRSKRPPAKQVAFV